MRIWGTKLPMVSRTYNNLNIEQTTSFLLPLPHVRSGSDQQETSSWTV